MKEEKKYRRAIFIFHFPSSIFQRTCGFTLLEVLISLAIVGGLLITLIYALNYHLTLIEKQETVTVAMFLAKNKMAAMENNREEVKGIFDAPHERYSYETLLRDSPYPGIAEAVVIVRSGHDEVTLNEFIVK